MESPLEIKKLDETVVNRIAAGEVIQRPANALKELIENSLDAKSTNIQITVKNGGLKLLQIQDNGIGIRKDDLDIVCERFTTSKLREFEDLSTIQTYGFRGEALASISHVAHLTIISKVFGDACAYKAKYVDGKLKDLPKPIAGNQGTQIIVEDLFYIMSIRQRSLRSPAEEYQKISEIVSKYAVHNANVGFGLKKQGENNDIRTPPHSTHVDNIRTIYGNQIARELIEFDIINDTYKFKASGHMTNVNYSTKKFNFLLFINHRLVNCQSLRKCLDQVYSMYLPKNMHPFIYLSLELNPRNVDVNIHPTKHEVNFLNEDQIVEQITTAIEAKLLGTNNSRVFYTQAKLPGFSAENVRETNSTTKIVQDKDLVRTDAAEQKITKFFGASVDNNDAENFTENECAETYKQLLEKNDNFDQNLLDIAVDLENVNGISENVQNKTLNTNLVTKVTKVDTQLLSILQLRKEAEDNCHLPMRDLFSQHVFVGSIDSTYSLIQHSTRLYLCNTTKILQQLFYQFFIYNFQNFGAIQFKDGLAIDKLAMMALDLPEAGWTPEDGNKTELAQKVMEILVDKADMLREYFSMDVNECGLLKSLPLLLENYTPDVAGLPMYVLRLATEVIWDTEKECFKTFAEETALYYSKVVEDDSGKWKWTTEHVFYPAIKDYFLPPKTFTENAAVLQIADLPNLYKVFERC